MGDDTTTIDRPGQPVTDPETARQADLAHRQAQGFRALADLIEAHPEFAERLSMKIGESYRRYATGLQGIDMTVSEMAGDAEPRAVMAAWGRAARAHGATTTQDSAKFDDWRMLHCDFADGAVRVTLSAPRDEVCERVVTGVETVTEQVPDPALLAAVPMVEQTREVETVEWRCRPLLAPADTATEVTR